MPKKMDNVEMERKQFVFDIKTLDVEGRTIEGHAACFDNVDLVKDVIRPGAFAKTITERGAAIKFLWQHDKKMPLGKIQMLQEDGKGLFFKAVISKTRQGNDAIALLEDKAIEGMSIGYDVIGAPEYVKVDDETVRELKELRLHEISLVTFPANTDAEVTSLKEDGTAIGDASHTIANDKDESSDPVDEDKVDDMESAMREINDAFLVPYRAMRDTVSPEVDYPWVKETHASHLIIEQGNKFFQVNYVRDADGNLVFAPRGEWLEGDYRFVPGAKALDSLMECKEGRVLSGRNRALMTKAVVEMTEAMQAIQALLDATNPKPRELEVFPPRKDEPNAPAKVAEDNEAGPDENPPTRERVLKLQLDALEQTL